MENFIYQCPTKIIFGKNSENRVGEEIKGFSDKILFIYGKESIKKSCLYDRVKKSLSEANIGSVELPGVQPNPRLELVKKGIEACRKHNLDFILAVGGGSVIDTGKAVAIGVPYNGDVWDFYESKRTASKALPIGVVLTIPAAGSEASPGSVIFDESSNRKIGTSIDITRPKFAILNPELTFTLSTYQKACGICDIMAHILERYFTPAINVDLTDRLCEATLKTVINNSKIAIEESNDYNSHAEIMWAGTIAHNDLLGTGRIGDWASHIIETEIGGIYDSTHGEGLAVVIPAWMKYVYKKNITKFLQYSRRVWDVNENINNDESMALKGIEKTENFFRELGLPTRLKDMNISDNEFHKIAQRCTESRPIGSYVKLSYSDILNILKIAKRNNKNVRIC